MLLQLSLLLLCAAAEVDSAIGARLASGAHARVLVALRAPGHADAVLTALNPERYRLVARFETVPALILDTNSQEVITALAGQENVSAIELDSGGYGVFAGPQPVQKVARVAVFDTGLPDVEKLNSTEKLASEQCFCRTNLGNGCCPDGSVQQEGTGAARENLPFETTSLAWLQIPNEPPKEFRAYVTWDPFISVYKVIPRGDAFDSWESVFRAVDALEASAEYQRQDVVLFSLASAKLYLGPCDQGQTALEQIWRSILQQLAEKRVSVLLTAAHGGPGPGISLPGCFETVAGPTRIPSSERLPMAAGLSGGEIGGSIGQPGPPPAPVARNASVGLGVVEEIRAARPDEVPAVDTVQGQTFSVVKIRVRDVSSVREGLASLLEAGKTADFFTLENPGLTAGAVVKFSSTLTGFEGSAKWLAEAWRPVIANNPQADPQGRGRRR